MKPNEAVSKACHPAFDTGSPEKRALIIRGLRVKPAMTYSFRQAFETASLNTHFQHTTLIKGSITAKITV